MTYYRRGNALREHIITISILLPLLCAMAIGSYYYVADAYNIINLAGYLGCIFGVPIVLVIAFWRKKVLRYYLLAALLIVTPLLLCRYYLISVTVDTDFSNYINGDSVFFETAKKYLPSGEKLLCAEDVEYLHNKSNADREYMWISLQYSAEEFEHIADALNNTYINCSNNDNTCYKDDDFIYYGQVYKCLEIMNGEYYAMAYSICDNTHIINIIFLTDSDLSSIAVRYVLDSYDWEK